MVLLDLVCRSEVFDLDDIEVLHVDTGHNYSEVLLFRDEVCRRYGLTLRVAKVEQAIQEGRLEDNPNGRNHLQSQVLLEAIQEHGYRVLLGGARRDEDRARAKERIFSIRDISGGWRPESQALECWELNLHRLKVGEHLRVFPLSHWTEIDIWHYIDHYKIPLPELYYAHHREVYQMDGLLIPVTPLTQVENVSNIQTISVRFRTVGDMSCTAVVPSLASNAKEVLDELKSSAYSERGNTRLDDKVNTSAMEVRKREGYF